MIEGYAVLNDFVCRSVRRYNDAGVVIKERGGPISQMSITSDVSANVITLNQVLNGRGSERCSHIYARYGVSGNNVSRAGDCSADGVHRGAKDHAHPIVVGYFHSAGDIGAHEVALYQISARGRISYQNTLKGIAGKDVARRRRGPANNITGRIYFDTFSISD